MDIKNIIDKVVAGLSDEKKYAFLHHSSSRNIPMPSIESLDQIMELLKKVIFPGFGHSEVSNDTMNYYIGANLDIIYRMVSEQIKRGFCFDCGDIEMICNQCETRQPRAF